MKKVQYSESVEELDCTDMDDFTSFINKRLEYRYFIWRGQSDSNWLLEPTLERILKKIGKSSTPKLETNHLERFQMASRGRRGPTPASISNQNDWWALGQHNGLATPLLDWTRSPFVALFFAFQEMNPSTSGKRTVFGLSQATVKLASDKISKTYTGSSRPNIIQFVEPQSDENARLVNQNGLFTRSPSGMDIETWVRKNIDHADRKVRLYKIHIPEIEREKILQSLNRMNINHLSLFPDLYGASKFVNFDLIINAY